MNEREHRLNQSLATLEDQCSWYQSAPHPHLRCGKIPDYKFFQREGRLGHNVRRSVTLGRFFAPTQPRKISPDALLPWHSPDRRQYRSGQDFRSSRLLHLHLFLALRFLGPQNILRFDTNRQRAVLVLA